VDLDFQVKSPGENGRDHGMFGTGYEGKIIKKRK